TDLRRPPGSGHGHGDVRWTVRRSARVGRERARHRGPADLPVHGEAALALDDEMDRGAGDRPADGHVPDACLTGDVTGPGDELALLDDGHRPGADRESVVVEPLAGPGPGDATVAIVLNGQSFDRPGGGASRARQTQQYARTGQGRRRRAGRVGTVAAASTMA